MDQVEDHVVRCDEGFYDMQRYPCRVEHGGTVTVTKATFKQMQHSDPSVRLLRIQPPKDILQSIVESARAEKRAKEAVEKADKLVEMKTAASTVTTVADEPDWQPVGWYKGQLNKNGGMDD